MPKIFNADHALTEDKNAVEHKVAGDPGSPVDGERWYDTVAHRIKYRLNGVTKTLAHLDEIVAAVFGSPTASAPGDTSSAGSGSQYARDNHRHARENHGASEHSSLSLSNFAAPTADLSLGSHKATGALDGTADTDLATVGQMNALFRGLDWKDDVRAASTANGTLASAFENGDTLDGVTLATGDRILLKNQTTGSENGIYVVQASGAPVRAGDADTSAKIKGAATIVAEGTVNGNSAWYLGTDSITLGTTALVFSAFPGAGGTTATAPIVKTGNDFSFAAAASVGTSGPGGGLTNGGAVDKDVVVIKYAATFGDGAASSFVITHGLGSKDVSVTVRDVSTDAIEYPDVNCSSTTQVTIDYGSVVPANNGKRVVVKY